MTLKIRRMFCPDTEAFERVAVPQAVPCDDGPCRSPIACGGFGYCRQRNLRNPLFAAMREKDMIDGFLGKWRP